MKVRHKTSQLRPYTQAPIIDKK